MPANLYQPKLAASPPNTTMCHNETINPETRHTCPGAFGGITPEQCGALGCCFSNRPCTRCPWCFTPDHIAGPMQFHNDGDTFLSVSASDPVVEWVDQGWWGKRPATLNTTITCDQSNCFCHCVRLPTSPVFRRIQLPYNYTNNDGTHCGGNNGLSMLQPDNITVIQTQPAYRCGAGSPLFSESGGCPQDYPRNVSILSSGYETALGAHGGSGLSALGGTLRLHELLPDAPPISHVLKIELYAHQYYYGGPKRLNPATSENGGRTQYVWPATGSDGYTFMNDSRLGYNGSNPYLAPGSLMVLPPGTAEGLNISTIPAKRIADALTKYGAYIVDDTASDSAAICMEVGADEVFKQYYNFSVDTALGPWYNDLVKIFQQLHIVINNAPSSIGGGGTPVVPLSPPICDI